jgi:hypothetical protein
MRINQLWDVTTALSQTPASTASFGIPALLVDHADVPLYANGGGYILTGRSSYATDLTAASEQLNWCAALWGQTYNVANAYICRWAKAATASECYMPDATQVASVYAALTNTADFDIVEGTASETITPDFTGDTTMADVAASIQTALQLGTISASYTCQIDSQDNMVITSDNTGASAAAVSIATSGVGTDLTGALYLGSSVAIAGLDAEALGTAMNRVLGQTDAPYAWHVATTPSVAQVTAFSTAVNALNKFLFLRESDVTAKTNGVADFSYAIDALNHNRTHGTYTEHTTVNGASADQFPTAAICGEILPRSEGSTNYAMTPMSGLSESGLSGDNVTVLPLSDTERGFLEGKACDYLITPANLTHLRNGLTYGGNEVRVMIARDWFNYWIMFDTYSYLIAQNVVTYSDRDLAAIRGIITHYADILVDRNCLESDYTIDMPLASSFTAAQKATHTLTLSNVFDADVSIAINDGVITMSWSV